MGFSDEFKDRVTRYEKRPVSLEETQEKASIDQIRTILEKGEEQEVPQPLERIDGAFSN